MTTYLKFIILFFFFAFPSCGKEEPLAPVEEEKPLTAFDPPVDLGVVGHKAIDEASGIVASKKNPHALWVHNDSGAEPQLFLIDTLGKHLATFHLQGAANRDWEDIAIGPGPKEGESYIYIGEIGDNQAVHDSYKIYRIPEPQINLGDVPVVDTLYQADVIEYEYPDGKRDAETLLLDPVSKDLYVVSKRDEFEHIYRVAYPQNTTEKVTLEKTGELPIQIGGVLDQIVGGDISADGNEVLLKSYVRVLYWKKENPTISLTDLLQQEPAVLPYTVEPQGEAIGFAADSGGYFTLSEAQGGAEPHLYFYKRKK